MVFLLSQTQLTIAQTMSRSIINSTGSTFFSGGLNMTTSVGEHDVQKYSQNIILYQGFLQPLPPMEPRLITHVVEANSRDAFSFFPNPVVDFLTIQIEKSEKYSYIFFNVFGQKVKEGEHVQGKISLTDFAAGVYYLELSSIDRRVIKSIKIIKL